MDKTQFGQKIEEIGKKYRKIHKILFTYGIFFVIAIFAGIKIYTTLSVSDSQISTTDQLQTQKNIKIQEFIKKIKLIDQQQTLTGPISLGQFNETDDYIESFNNLLYYKGFVLPRFFRVSKTAPLQSIEYFNKGTYTIDELDTLFKNIFIGSNRNTKQPTQNISFPISKGIIDEFNLQCIFQSKISSFVCDIFVYNFLESFFIYTIETDIDTFSNIMNTLLKQKKYNDQGCTKLLYYAYYTEKGNETIEKLLQQCDPKHQERYRLFVDFAETQKELFNKFISNKIYKDEMINIYKLISFQQIINDDITNKIINTDRINGYFGFLQEILKKDKVGLFYKELTYFFNNYYLKKAIENIEITSKIANKTEINTIAKQITSINNGNQLIGYTGLKEQINKNILELDTIINQDDTNNENYEQRIDNLLQQIKDLEIKQKFLSGNNILLYGIRKIENKIDSYSNEAKIISIATKLRLEENNNTLTLKQIMLEGFDEISLTINRLIENQKRSFADLQKYMYQNSSIFGTISTLNEDETTNICKKLTDSLVDQEVKVCNNNRIDIDILRKNKIITMTIIHDNFILNKIDISDQDAKELFNEYLKDPDIISQITYDKVTKVEFVTFVQKTITDFLNFSPKDSQNFEGSTNTIIIIERIKKYLGIQVNDIVEKNDKILLDFVVTGIPFLGYYNLQEDKIAPIYFKEANQTKTPILIKNIALTLSDENKAFLNLFMLQPLEIIKQYSPEEYLLYQKFISEKY